MSSPEVTDLAAREVLDCRGLPTVQVDLRLADGTLATADVPSGRSTGSAEAVELRDGGRRFGGFGVRGAVGNVNGELRDALVGAPLPEQRHLDAALIELDGSERKSRLGANAILGVSLAAARARAAHAGVPLYRSLSSNGHLLPAPLVNLINGGKHASNDLDFQEFIVIPVGADSIVEALQISTEVNLALAEILLDRYGKSALNTGDEGGYAPAISDPREALGLLHEAVTAAGHAGRFRYGLDCAATHYHDRDARAYEIGGETRDTDAMIELYLTLIRDFDVVTIEDPLDEEDLDGFAALTEASGIQIVGDDLFVTDRKRLAAGVERGAANSLLWKVNQIGTLSEALDAAELAHRSGYTVVVSERSGETEDPIIADLAVALNAGQIKTGAPVRGERTAKYNRLIRIEEELGSTAEYAGDIFGGGRSVIANAAELAGGELADLRSLALRVAGAGLEACDVRRATEEAVSPSEAGVRIGGRDYALQGDAQVIVVGAGKATLAIVAALERVLGDRIDRGAIVVREGENVTPLERVDVIVADHPLPTERSVAGANRLIEVAEAARAGDLVVAVFTGGSSALASLPPPGVSAAEKRRLHELLLASGAPIADVNTVRKHVSRIKGGRLAELIVPATLVNLTASDVAGDIIDAITDPTVEDSSTVGNAVGVLRERGLWSQVPASVRAHLDRAEARSPTLGLEPQTVLLVTGRSACEAMAREAESAGATARVVSTELEGEASAIGRMLVRLAGEARNGDVTAEAPRVLVGCGGEATVSLGADGAFGAGGPNQEAAVAAALALGGGAAVSACFLDTDGSDGGTDAAGAIVDGNTLARAAMAGVDLADALASHRSGEALSALGDRVITGPTRTNVNDLFVVAVAAGGGSTRVTEPMIVLDRVSRTFGELQAVDDVSVEIGAGEFFSMLGPSGCGKTTTLRLIAGFEEPDAGRLLLAGEDVTLVSPRHRNVNMVFQDYALFPHMTVGENVEFGLRLKGVRGEDARSRIAEMLAVVRLDGLGERRPAELSGGQRQRVALARALVNRPAALLLDEPLGALDLKLRREMQLELKRIQQSTGTTFVYVTHDQEEALTMSDRIAVMDGGRVEQLAAPRDLYEHPSTSFVAGFIGTSNGIELAVTRREGELAVMELGEGMRIVAADPGGAAASLRLSVRPEKIQIGAAEIADGSRVAGTVVDRVYLGSLSQTVVELASGERLVVHQLNDDETSSPEPGERVTLSWAARHSLVVDATGGAG